MKTNKTILILAAITIVATFVYIGIQHRKIERLSDQSQLQAVELATLTDSVTVYKTTAGKLFVKYYDKSGSKKRKYLGYNTGWIYSNDNIT